MKIPDAARSCLSRGMKGTTHTLIPRLSKGKSFAATKPHGDLKMDSEDRSTRRIHLPSAGHRHGSDLIARLEKATGPDRELDAAIAASVGLPMMFCDFDTVRVTMAIASPGLRKPLGSTDERRSYPPNDWRDDERLPCLYLLHRRGDDAGAEGMEKDFTDLYGVARVCWDQRQSRPVLQEHEGGSLAIALCIAALKARSLPAI